MYKTVKRFVSLIANYKLLGCVVIAMVIGLILEVLHQQLIARWMVSLVAIISLIPLLNSMWQTLRAGSYGIDLPGVIAIVVSILLGQHWAAVIMAAILILNLSLRKSVDQLALRSQTTRLGQMPNQAHIYRKHKLIDIPLHEVRSGDEIEIRSGEIIPVDAVIIKGSGRIDEQSLTGNRQPQLCAVGDTILGGTINGNEVIVAKALHTAIDSQYRQLGRFRHSATDSTAPFIKQADRYSVMFMLLAYIVATAAWLLSKQPVRFLEVFIIASPIAFLVVPEITLLGGLGTAFKKGITFKTKSTFEQLATAKTFAFDKTDTLTHQSAEIDSTVSFKPYSQKDVLLYAASLSQRSSHLFAQAVGRTVVNQKLKPPKAKHIREFAAYGAEARVGSKEIEIGTYASLMQRGVTMPKQFKASDITQAALFVSVDKNMIGYITFKESYRDDMATMLKTLVKYGIKRTLLLTEDGSATASHIAKRLGVTDIHSKGRVGDELLALEAVSERPLVFIGNGRTDAPALTTADVGIAIGARGSTVSGQAANIVIMQDDLDMVGMALAIAKRTFRIAKQTLVITVVLNFILLVVLATGKVQPIADAGIRFGLELLIVLLAWLLGRQTNGPH
jgi:heavy metal translocating P-type ATPase